MTADSGYFAFGIVCMAAVCVFVCVCLLVYEYVCTRSHTHLPFFVVGGVRLFNSGDFMCIVNLHNLEFSF